MNFLCRSMVGLSLGISLFLASGFGAILPGSSAAATFVGGTGVTHSLAFVPVAGNAMVVSVGTNSTTISSIACTGAACTFGTPLATSLGTNNARTTTYAVLNVPSGVTGITVTMAADYNTCHIGVKQYSGVATVSAVDQSLPKGGYSASIDSALISTTNANDVIVATGSYYQSITSGPTNSFVNITPTPLTTQNIKMVMADRIVATAGTYSTSWVAAGDAWESTIVSLKASTSVTQSALLVTTSSLTSGSVGVASSQLMAAAGGVTPYSWSSSSSMPAGMSLSSGGIFQGTPTTAGTSSLNMQVADSAGGIANKVLSMTVSGVVGSFPVSQNPGPNMVPATDSAGILNIPAGINTGSPKTCATLGPAVFPSITVISDGVPGAVNCGCPLGGGTTGALAFAKLNGQWSCPLLP